MEKEHRLRLQSLRMELLENIYDVDGIIDRLYAMNILTLPMKDKIMQKRGLNRLRELLDSLPKRGDEAFRAFYEVLVKCGEDTAADLLCPELAAQRKSRPLQDDELPAKWPDFDSHNVMKRDVTKVSEGSEMKVKFDRTVAGSETVYAMHKPTRGIFLLISNQHFKEARSKGVELSDRDGTEKDTMALMKVFGQLHFRMVTKVNLRADKMKEAVETMAREVEATDNCFACAVLTHGERGVVYGVDGKTVALEDMTAAVTDRCEMLIGKPKIFVIQACQGRKVDNGAAAADAPGDAGKTEIKDIEEFAEEFSGNNVGDTTQSDARSGGRMSSKSDIFVAIATVPDFVSWRNTEWGTWFIQAVAYIFSQFAHKYEINQLMVRVNKLVSRAETAKGYKQVSVYSSSLTSDFYFFPGLQH